MKDAENKLTNSENYVTNLYYFKYKYLCFFLKQQSYEIYGLIKFYLLVLCFFLGGGVR